jgi:hypothetical protein
MMMNVIVDDDVYIVDVDDMLDDHCMRNSSMQVDENKNVTQCKIDH